MNVISRANTKAKICEHCDKRVLNGLDVDDCRVSCELIQLIDKVRVIEAEPIVHCRDCIYRPVGHVAHNVSAPVIDGVEYRVCPCLCEDSWYSTNPADDFFCAKGSIGV